MISNDRNIETIGELVEALKRYIDTKKDFWKLDLIEKVVRLFTVLTLMAVLALTLLMVLIYVSFAVAYALAGPMGNVGAFLCVAGFYVLLFLLLVVFRKQLLERPVVRFMVGLLTNDE